MSQNSELECSICLQICVQPVQLPCTHVFCYLCMKGIAQRNRKCALCRVDIPQDFMQNPKLIDQVLSLFKLVAIYQLYIISYFIIKNNIG